MDKTFWEAVFSLTQVGIFFWIFILGASFALVTFIMGEIFDGLDDIFHGLLDALHLDSILNSVFDIDDVGTGPSIFSTRVISVFVMVFGGTGLMASANKMGPFASSGIGVACGVCCAFIFLMIFRWIHSQQSSSVLQSGDLVGKRGTIKTSIPAGGVGEVIIDNVGQRITRSAKSADGKEIEFSSSVVVREISGNLATVSLV